jgi:MFS family permease
MATILKEKNFFYGWVILGISFLVMAVIAGGGYYAFGVFFKPMITEFGWSRGTGAIGFSLMLVVGGLLAPLIGVSLVRFGARKIMVFGHALLIMAFLLLSRTTELWHLYIIFGVMCGIGMACAAFNPVTTMVNNWFIRRRAFALGIAMAGVGVGTVVLAPAVRYLVEVIGWQSAWLALAGLIFVFALIPALIFVRSKPEDMGQIPDGVKPPAEQKDIGPVVKRVYTTPVDWETRAAVRTPALWLTVVFLAANLFTINMLATHQVAHLEDIGISPIMAAGALGIMVGFSSAGRLIIGTLGDRIEPRYIAAFACLMQVIGLLIFINAKALGLIYAYVVLYGTSNGAISVLSPTLIGAYYGRKNFATIQGIAWVPALLIGAIAPTFAGFVFDVTGSYLIPVITAVILCAAGGVCALLAKPPSPPIHQGKTA